MRLSLNRTVFRQMKKIYRTALGRECQSTNVIKHYDGLDDMTRDLRCAAVSTFSPVSTPPCCHHVT